MVETETVVWKIHKTQQLPSKSTNDKNKQEIEIKIGWAEKDF